MAESGDTFGQFKQTFFEECSDLLGQLEAALADIDVSAPDVELLNQVFRAVHSIKAGAGAFKFHRLVTFSHELENLLDLYRENRRTLTAAALETLLRAGDVLADLVFAARDGADLAAGHEMALLTAVKALIDDGGAAPGSSAQFDAAPGAAAEVTARAGAASAASADATGWLICFTPSPSLFRNANEPLRLFRELARLGTLHVEIDDSALPPLRGLDPEQSYFSWTLRLSATVARESVAEVFEFVIDDCALVIEPWSKGKRDAASAALGVDAPASDGLDAPPAEPATAGAPPSRDAAPASARSRATSIRVDLDRVDRLVDMVGELVIAQSMAVEQLISRVDASDIADYQGLEDLALRTRQLQEGVMAIRMQPVKTVFSRMPRVVRELAGALGKEIRLEVSGEATEVDKTIIEELADPLTHMIRNSVDHGLEGADERVAAGKSREGVIRLSAEHRSGRVLIRVSDDGRGLDRDRILQKAREKGLVDPAAELTPQQIENLIFLPGFSTAAAVSDVSGRGVGMDVVRRNIQKLGGRVTVESQKGEGTRFVLALPLTLAVLDGMLVGAADERYVIPLSSVVETVCPKAEDIRASSQGGQVLSLRGEVLRLIDLRAVFGLRAAAVAERKLVMIVETELGQRLGVVVDEVFGQQQVVIKSLESSYRRVDGVSGAAILGDGRVRLILDIDGLAAIPPQRRQNQGAARAVTA